MSAKALGQAGDYAKYRGEITALKEEIREKLSVNELKRLKQSYDITFPGLYDDAKFTKEDYIKNLAPELKLETLKRRIKSNQFLNYVNTRERQIEEWYSKRKEDRWKKEEISPEEAIEEENPLLNNLLNALEDMFLLDKIFDERELHNSIFSSLKNNPQYNYAKEEYIVEKKRPDIVINDTVIELKFIKDKNNAKNKLREAWSQAQEYEDIDFIKNVILFFIHWRRICGINCK